MFSTVDGFVLDYVVVSNIINCFDVLLNKQTDMAKRGEAEQVV